MPEIDIRPVGYFEIWPRQKWKWFVLLFGAWALVLYLGLRLESQVLNPFQQWYLPAYIRTTLYLDSSKPKPFLLLQVLQGDTWLAARPDSIPGYNGHLKENVLPAPLPDGLHVRWQSLAPSNADLRLFLRDTFFGDRPLFSITPWSQPCVFFWSCLLALALPLTIPGAFLIDFHVTKRLRSGVVLSGTRLHTRTSFLRRIARWKGLWAPWKLGLTFRVSGRLYPSDAALAPVRLLARLAHGVAVYCRSAFPRRQFPWIATAFTCACWFGLYYNASIRASDLAAPFSHQDSLRILLGQLVICLFTTSATVAIILPGPTSRLSRALRPRILGVPADKEDHHFLLMGDTGTGKSTLLRQIIRHIQDRGETLVIYDPDGTFASEFYNPKRGDVILNPRDRRCPYWQPNFELQDAGESESLAAGYYPDVMKGASNSEFFSTAARKILAYLFTHRATASDIADWLADPDKLTALLEHTELKQYVAEYAGQMRGGVEATLSAVVNGLRLLPPDHLDPDPNDPSAHLQPRRVWSALNWQKTRQGWIFITNDKTHRPALLPLISAWLDSILLRLMTSDPREESANVWVVLDELASLHRLPQLKVGITETRKHNVRMVLGFQGIAQLQENYGVYVAETLLSQPATKIFLRTSENKGAKWVQDNLGHQDLEITTKTLNQKTGVSFSKKTERVPVAPMDTIAHLDDLAGYMSHGKFITGFTLRFVDGVQLQPNVILRNTALFTPVEPPRSLQPRPLQTNQPSPTSPSKPPASSSNPSNTSDPDPKPLLPSPQPEPPSQFALPTTYSGFWLGTLAVEWGLKEPISSQQVASLLSGLHPLTGKPLPTNNGSRAITRLDYRFSIVGPIPADPTAPIPQDALDAHHAAISDEVHKRFPTPEIGKWVGVIIDTDPTRAADDSTLELNSYVFVFHLKPPKTVATEAPVGQASDPPEIPDPVPQPTASSDLSCLLESVIAATPTSPEPVPVRALEPAQSAASHSVSVAPPNPSRSTEECTARASSTVMHARRESLCPACAAPIHVGVTIMKVDAGWKHLNCPVSPTNS